MYSRPTVYKVYSIVSAIFAIYTFLQCIISAFTLSLGYLDSIQTVSSILTVVKVIMIVFAFCNLFFAYMDFSSFFCFSKLIAFDKESKEHEIDLPTFILAPNVYKIYGKVLYWLCVTLMVLGVVLSLIIGFVTGIFYMLPVAIVIAGIGIPFLYFTIYTRYIKISELMETVKVNKVLKFEKSLSDYCIYRQYSKLFYVLSVLSVVLDLVLLVALCISSAIVVIPIGQIILTVLSLMVSMFIGFLSNFTFASFYTYLSKQSATC